MPTPKKFTVYRASAGSGKTFTLVREYLALALQGSDREIDDNFRHILAITFTNKATNQMKEKILEYVGALQDPVKRDSDDIRPMTKALCEELCVKPQELSRRAAVLQKAILHNYSDFSVCTIDSFMNRIVRTFAVDLGLSPRFEISMDADILLDTAVDKLIDDISSDNTDITDILLKYSRNEMEEGGSFKVRNRIRKASEAIVKEDFLERYKYLKDISLQDFCKYADILRKKNREYEDFVKGVADEICKDIADKGFSDDDFAEKTKGLYSYFRKISDRDFSKICGTATIKKIIDGDQIAHNSSPRKDEVEALAPKMREAFSKIQSGSKEYVTRKVLLANVFQMALLKDVRDKMTEYYSESEILHISENNKRVSEEVRKEEAPFIFERLGCRYRHFLIDEFQDTSIMQWQNLLPLITNGLSEGHRSLIVGDGKQAIYRFRQGDVEQFQHMITKVPDKASEITRRHYESIIRNGKEVPLGTNFRSCGNIVEFNNHFFTYLEKQLQRTDMKSELMHEIYVGSDEEHPSLAQEVCPGKKNKGYVEIAFFDKDHFADDAPMHIYKTLCHLKSIGYNYKDIAILSQTKDSLSNINMELAAINEREGSLKDLQFASAESLRLSKNPDSGMLLSLLKYVHNGDEKVHKLEIAEYLSSHGHPQFDCNIFVNEDAFDKAIAEEFPDFNRNLLLSQTLYDCCYNLIRIFGIPQTPYIYTFLNKVADYSVYNRTDLGGFLEWLDDKWSQLSTTTSDDLDAISLMTIHKSKGLENNVIIYYDKKPADHPDISWVDIDKATLGIGDEDIPNVGVGMVKFTQSANLENTFFDEDYLNEKQKKSIDELNLLYVALTRPKRHLYVLAKSTKDKDDGKKKKSSSGKSSSSLIGILEGYVNADESGFVKEDGKDVSVYSQGDKKFGIEESPVSESCYLKANTTKPWPERINIVGPTDSIMQPEDTPQQKIGNIVHEILSKIGTLDEVEEVKNDFFAEAKLDKELEQRVSDLLHSVLETNEVRPFFDSKYDYKTECEILLGKDFVRPECFEKQDVVRPDRIVFAGDETWVVDFKTGDKSDKYKAQVNGYMSVLKAMGCDNVKGFLLYISSEGCSVEEV